MTSYDSLALVLWYALEFDDPEVRRVAAAMSEAMPMPLDKASRWLGYVQGWLVHAGACTVDDCRRHIREGVWK